MAVTAAIPFITNTEYTGLGAGAAGSIPGCVLCVFVDWGMACKRRRMLILAGAWAMPRRFRGSCAISCRRWWPSGASDLASYS